jgi:hypothetical protein
MGGRRMPTYATVAVRKTLLQRLQIFRRRRIHVFVIGCNSDAFVR